MTESLEKCPMYEQGKAAERRYFGKTIIACLVKPSVCPFNNSEEVKYGGETIINICKSGGLVEMTYEHPIYTLRARRAPRFFVDKDAKLPPEIILKSENQL